MAGIIVQPAVLGPKKENKSVSISELYHENSKLQPSLPTTMIAAGNYTETEILAMGRGYKQYRLAPQIKLPETDNLLPNDKSFEEVVASRRSVRDFFDKELSLNELSKLLHQSYGITGEVTRPDGGTIPLRASPSGGALYPAEIYLGIRRVSGVEPGIYHYNVPDHALELLKPGDPTEELYETCCQQEYTRQASVVFLISGVLQRTKRKYGERGYRYVFLDVGHLGQNIYLSSTALNLAVMTTCGFFDDVANKLLRIDGIDETTLYVAFVGKKKDKRVPESH
jgi:SagB-type dehydrogenase family enzyme